MHKFIKAFLAVAVLGIAVQTFASKGESVPTETNLGMEWKNAVEQLDTLATLD